jgi:hypothetical protein
MPDTADPCERAPAGESHRWKLPDQGAVGVPTCKWCGAERAFTDARLNRWSRGRPAWKPRAAGEAP